MDRRCVSSSAITAGVLTAVPVRGRGLYTRAERSDQLPRPARRSPLRWRWQPWFWAAGPARRCPGAQACEIRATGEAPNLAPCARTAREHACWRAKRGHRTPIPWQSNSTNLSSKPHYHAEATVGKSGAKGYHFSVRYNVFVWLCTARVQVCTRDTYTPRRCASRALKQVCGQARYHTSRPRRRPSPPL